MAERGRRAAANAGLLALAVMVAALTALALRIPEPGPSGDVLRPLPTVSPTLHPLSIVDEHAARPTEFATASPSASPSETSNAAATRTTSPKPSPKPTTAARKVTTPKTNPPPPAPTSTTESPPPPPPPDQTSEPTEDPAIPPPDPIPPTGSDNPDPTPSDPGTPTDPGPTYTAVGTPER